MNMDARNKSRTVTILTRATRGESGLLNDLARLFRRWIGPRVKRVEDSHEVQFI